MEALNQKEQKFAADHHDLIYAFLRCYNLPGEEYYDLLAIAYLKAVKEYSKKPELRKKCAFSTIAFQKMRDAKIKKYHSDRVRAAYIAFSLNDLNEAGNEYIEELPDPCDIFHKKEQQENLEEFMEEILPVLTKRQREHLIRLAENGKPHDMMQEMHVSVIDFWKDRRAIREAATAAMERKFRGGT